MAKSKKQKDEIQEEIIEQVEVNEIQVIDEVVGTEAIIEEVVVEKPTLFPYVLIRDIEVSTQKGLQTKKKGATIYSTIEGAKYLKKNKYIK